MAAETATLLKAALFLMAGWTLLKLRQQETFARLSGNRHSSDRDANNSDSFFDLLTLVRAHDYVQLLLEPASSCSRSFYETTIHDLCLAKFEQDMAGLDQGLWCSWPDTIEWVPIKHSQTYEGLTNCTYQVALRVDCFWPNRAIDSLFAQVHQRYFAKCALTGRLLHDPPSSVLAPFIAVPVLVTLLMTALVVWRSKRTEGVL